MDLMVHRKKSELGTKRHGNRNLNGVIYQVNPTEEEVDGRRLLYIVQWAVVLLQATAEEEGE